MINFEKDRQDSKAESDSTVVAVFQSRSEARAAIAALHKAKFTHTWLGTTNIAEKDGGGEALTVESTGFFSGSQSLIDALVSHGVSSSAAHSLEGRIESGNALLTLNPKDRDVSEALDIIAKHGGRIPDGASGDWDPWTGSTMSDDSYQIDDGGFEEIIFVRR